MKAGLFFLAVLAVFLSASNLSETISTPVWWDTAWHYRVGANVNTGQLSRYNWPIEVDVNFTDLIRQKNATGTFDLNSTRVVEHNSTGGVMYLVPSQFDAGIKYNASSSAVGTIIFLLNGTTLSATTRYFYIYFDTVENGAKSPVTYSSTLNYSWDGEEFVVNNTNFIWRADTIRGENTSGLYDVRGRQTGNIIMRTASNSSKTKEYTQFSNGTKPLMFDFRNNATFKPGPLRLTVTQSGGEAYWNDPANKTGEGLMVKKYIFYENASWIRIDLNYTNTAAWGTNRSSTYGGAESLNELNSTEFLGAFYFTTIWGNSTNPASWFGASNSGSYGAGIVNENQTGTQNYYVIHDQNGTRIGVSLNSTTLSAGQSILQRAAMNFNDTVYNNQTISTFQSNIASPPAITMLSPESLSFTVQSSANYSVYNRGESALIFGNVTNDPYLQNSFVNATLDMAAQTIMLYDDGNPSHGDAVAGDRVFSNYFNFSQTNQTGTWNFTVRAYDSSGLFLNSSSSTFNLSDKYSVTTFIDTPLGLASRQMNATINVTNVRNDTYIPGAALNCTYGAGPLMNITDYGNGTYRLNFTAPSATGAYTLNCTAAKLNNSGWGTYVFYTEAATTTTNTTFVPASYNSSNVTWYASENFTLTINITDAGNATARDTNITLYLPSYISGPTFGQCGNIGIGASCTKPFNISVLNQDVPGTYRINVTTAWRNADTTLGGSNSSFNITVLPNPKIDVPQSIISGTVGDGQNLEIGSFNVTSLGNANASNITFAVTGLPASFAVAFNPANIPAIAPNQTNLVRVNVSVPPQYAPGTYNGSINSSSVDGGWKNLIIQIIIPPNTTMTSSASPASYSSSNVTWYMASENFTLTINTTNTGNSTARYANMTLYLPPQAIGPAFYSCGNISVSSSCIAPFNISVLNQTSPGTYWINITAAWRNDDASVGTSNSSFNITVLPNPKIDVPQSIISGTVGDGQNLEIGSFNVTSLGNANASNITFAVTGLPASFAVAFNPANISAIAPNQTNLVRVNVSVPFMYLAGNYSGTANASAQNSGWKTFVINVSVPENRSWTRVPPSCMGVEIADTGTVCTIVINNTGNAPINFTVAPPQANFTSVNETNFTIAYNSARYIFVSYNVSAGKGYYNATYFIYANTTNTTPQNASVIMYLLPYLEPAINSSLAYAPQSIGQNSSLEIVVNVTDRSGAGINWTYVNITDPSGIIFTSNATFNGSAGNATVWRTVFPSGFRPANQTLNISPATSQRGLYNVTMASADNSGAVGYSYSSFKVHRNLSVFLSTPFARYPEGDTQCTEGVINYTSVYFGNVPASGANATFGILSGDNFTWLMIPRQYTAYLDGKIYDNYMAPAFKICSSALAGNYTMISNTSFYDDVSNETVSIQKNSTFEVYSRPITIELVNPTFDSSNLAFRIWVRDIFGTYIAPDNMNISLFRDVFLSNGSVMSVPDVSFNMSDSRVVRENTSIGPKYIVSLSGLSTSAAYWIRTSASYGGRIGLAEKTFNPGVRTWYDVVLNMITRQASPGDYVDFELQVQNKAGNGQDVYVEYWVSNAGLEEKSWYSASMHIFINKDAMVFLPLRAYVFPTQPYGNYWLYARVTPSNDTSGFSWQAHDVFSVVQKPPTKPVYPPPTGGAITSGGAGAGGEAREKVKAVSIIKYPKNISTVRGWTDISSIEVKNTGELPISNLTLAFTGVPKSWYTLRPNATQGLSEGNSTVYLLEFKIPFDASPGTYDLVFTARADDVRDEKNSQLTIFSSAAEMLLAQIAELKSRLANLEAETRIAQAAGRNTTLVWPVLDSARSEVVSAENSFNNASYIDAENHVLIARTFLERAEFLIASAEFIKVVPAKIIPWWLIALVVALAFATSIAMLWTFRLKHRMNVFFKSPALMERVLLRFREDKTERAALIAEREKLVRMQNLLEKEVQDGTITPAAYEELNKRTLEKLAALDRKIRG